MQPPSEPSRTLDSLQRHAFFAELPPEEVLQVARAARRCSWSAGESIFQRGDAGEGLIVIDKGVIRLSLDSAQGRELTIRLAGPGEVIGEIALLDGGGRSADATAVTDVEAHMLSHGAFRALFATCPGLPSSVLKAVCRRLRETTDQLEAIALLPLEARLARLFVLFCGRGGAAGQPGWRAFELAISQRELAALVGASRPKVNQALIGWEQAGLMTRDGRTVRCHVAALAAIAGETSDS